MDAGADVTTRIEEFVKGAPDEALAILDTVKAEANNTAAFSVYLAKSLDGIANTVAANIKNHTKTGAPAPAVCQLIRFRERSSCHMFTHFIEE